MVFLIIRDEIIPHKIGSLKHHCRRPPSIIRICNQNPPKKNVKSETKKPYNLKPKTQPKKKKRREIEKTENERILISLRRIDRTASSEEACDLGIYIENEERGLGLGFLTCRRLVQRKESMMTATLFLNYYNAPHRTRLLPE